MNHRHRDFQSRALPTELPGRGLASEPEKRRAGRVYKGLAARCPGVTGARIAADESACTSPEGKGGSLLVRPHEAQRTRPQPSIVPAIVCGDRERCRGAHGVPAPGRRVIAPPSFLRSFGDKGALQRRPRCPGGRAVSANSPRHRFCDCSATRAGPGGAGLSSFLRSFAHRGSASPFAPDCG